MRIAREVIVDLLPVYVSGEASSATRTLVEEYLSQDPELMEQVLRLKSEDHLDFPEITRAAGTRDALSAQNEEATGLAAMAVRSGNILHSLFLELRDEHFWRTNSGVSFSASRLTSFCQLFGDWHLLLDRLLCHSPSTFAGSFGTVPKGRTFLKSLELIVGSTQALRYSGTMLPSHRLSEATLSTGITSCLPIMREQWRKARLASLMLDRWSCIILEITSRSVRRLVK